MSRAAITNSEMFSCEAARRRTEAYIDGRLSAEEMGHIRQHLAECPACAEESPAIHQLRSSLRSMPAPMAPQRLSTKLRVTASREASRQRSRRSLRHRWENWKSDVKLWTDNLMRPLAIPTAGGFASALVLFSAFASGIAIPNVSASTSADVPTGLYTEASVKSFLPLGFGPGDLEVELTIDDQGRVVDYKLPASIPLKCLPEMRRNVGNHLLFTQFTPATSFGQPLPGKVRLWFRNSRIDVKG